MAFLTNKEQSRLDKVREMLNNNINPYSELSRNSPDPRTIVDRNDVKELTPNERRKKFHSRSGLDKKGAHKRIYDVPLDHEVETRDYNNVLCIACNKVIEVVVTAVYGRIIVKQGTYVKEWIDELLDLLRRKVIRYPEYKVGYCCEECFNMIYRSTYIDWDNNLKRGIEILNKPSFKIKGAAINQGGHPTRIDSLDMNREKILSVTTVVKETDDYVIERKARIKVDPNEDKVDPKSYRYVMKGR